MIASATARLTAVATLLRRLRADTRGGVLIVVGFAIVPLTFAIGFGVDYARAMRLRTQLSAAADAAALAAVAPSMILQSDSAAKDAATKMFNAHAALLSGYKNLQATPVIIASTAATSSGATGYLRKATVTFTAQSINLFGGILGAETLTVNGTSSASAQQPPNIDFYLAMDVSPSMLLPATSDGVTRVQNDTGCAFACHQQMSHQDGIYIKNPAGLDVLLSADYYVSGAAKKSIYYLVDMGANKIYDSSGRSMDVVNPGQGSSVTYSFKDSDDGPVTLLKTTKSGASSSTETYDLGYWADGYWLTHNYGQLHGSPSSLVLRKDDVVTAATQLIPFAADQATQFKVTYRAQMFSFDWTHPGNSSPVTTLNTLKNVASYGSGFSAASIFPADDWWWKNSYPAKGTFIDDKASEMTNMLGEMNKAIPDPGTGAATSTPQKILFIVTDGMLDQPNGGGRYFGPLQQSDIDQCRAIKKRGIKIAVLYTQYLPESLANNDWSQSNVAPFLPAPPPPYPRGGAGSSDQVLTALQNCSSPGVDGAPLVQTVTSSGNIATALQQLFSTAVQTARLIQ